MQSEFASINISTVSKQNKNISEIEAFLGLLHHIMDHESSWKTLYEIWNVCSDSFLLSLTFERYSKFLTTFYISYDQPTQEIFVQQVPKIHPPSEAPNGAVEYISAMVAQSEYRQKVQADKYAWFESSWLLADYLAEYPEEIDPGRIISEYLTLLFPKEELDVGQEILGEFQASKSIRHGSQLYNLVLEMGTACIESIDCPIKTKTCLHIALTSFLDPRSEFNLPDGINFNNIIKATINASSSFFYSWARGWWLCLDYDTPPVTTDILKTVLSLGTIVGTRKFRKSTTEYGKPEFFTLNLLWDLVSKSNDDFNYHRDEELQLAISDIFSTYTTARQKIFYGISPVGYDAAYQFFIFIDMNMTEYCAMIDLTFLLSGGQYSFGELYLLPESKTPDSIIEEFDEKQKMYFLLFNKSIEEGLPELANALLSMYLLGRGIYCKCRFTVGKELEAIITKGLSLPGNKTLKHTLNKIAMEIERSFSSDPLALLSRRFLKQFIPQQAQLHVIGNNETEHVKRRTIIQKEIKMFLIEQLGEERWQKLSMESQNHLLDAQLLWRKNDEEFGFGIKDFSGMITGYCKVIEKELVDRLSEFYFSEVYGAYVEKTFKKERPKEPTAGWLIQLLMSYDRLGSDLQQMLDRTSVKVQHEKDLKSNLQTLIRHRNLAAHKDQYDMVQFSKFKKIYFQDETLHKFIDSIG